MDRRESARLDSLRSRVLEALQSGGWWTLRNLESVCGGSATGISAKMRDLRKPRYGGHTIEAQHVVDGCWRYRLVPKQAYAAEQMEMPLS